MALPNGGVVHASDWAPLETLVSKIVKEKQPFQRLVCSGERGAVGFPRLPCCVCERQCKG